MTTLLSGILMECADVVNIQKSRADNSDYACAMPKDSLALIAAIHHACRALTAKREGGWYTVPTYSILGFLGMLRP